MNDRQLDTVLTCFTFLFCVGLCAVALCAPRSTDDHSVVDTRPTVDHVEAYADSFIQQTRVLNRAYEYAPFLVDTSKTAGVNPLFMTFLAKREGSIKFGRTPDGKKGEQTTFQILPRGVCGAGQDLDTPRGAIRAAVRCVTIAIDECGHGARRVLSAYKCGRCRCRSESARGAIDRRLRDWERVYAEFGPVKTGGTKNDD